MFIDAFNLRGGILGLFSDSDAFNNLLFGMQDVPLPTKSGKIINAESSLGNSAVFACVDLLASKYSQVPIRLVQEQKDGSRKVVTDHKWARALGVSPNPEMDIVTFKKLLITLKLLRGQMFCEKKETGSYGYLWPLTSPTMIAQRNWSVPSHPLVYKYSFNQYIEHTDSNQFTDTYSADDLLIMLDFTLNGVIGVSRVSLAREAIALGLSYEEYSARLMQNDAVPRGFLVSQSALTKETKASMREEMQQAQLGKNRGKIGILDAMVDFKSTGLNNKDVEFLDSRGFQIPEVCRWFNRIPPHMICDLSRSSFSNIEQQSLEFLINCMDPLFASQEAAYDRSLLDDDELDAGYHFIHDRNALIAADLEAVADASQKDLLSGVKTINEVRKTRNLDPIKNGDVLFFNLGYGPVGNGFLTTNEIRKGVKLPPVEGGDVIMGLKSQQPETPDQADPQDKNNPMGGAPGQNPAGPDAPLPGQKNAPPNTPPQQKGPGQVPPAPGKPDKAGLKRAFFPVFLNAFERFTRKEGKQIEAMLRRTDGDHDDDQFDAIYSERHLDQVAEGLLPAVNAVLLMAGAHTIFSNDFAKDLASRHTPVTSIWFDADERARLRAEQELDTLLEMI